MKECAMDCSKCRYLKPKNDGVKGYPFYFRCKKFRLRVFPEQFSGMKQFGNDKTIPNNNSQIFNEIVK